MEKSDNFNTDPPMMRLFDDTGMSLWSNNQRGMRGRSPQHGVPAPDDLDFMLEFVNAYPGHVHELSHSFRG